MYYTLNEILTFSGIMYFVAGLIATIWPLIKQYAPKYLPSIDVSMSDSYDVGVWLSKNVKSFSKYVENGVFLPAPGWHVFYNEKTVFILNVYFKSQHDMSLRFKIYTYKKTAWIKEWVDRKISEMLTPVGADSNVEYVNIQVYTGDTFKSVPRKIKRPENTLIFRDNIHLSILKELKSFIKEESKYKMYGLAKSKGYCLYGPPGTGKTSIPLFLAGALNRNLIIIKPEAILHKDFMFDMTKESKRAILLFDDIDTILKQRPVQNKNATSDDTYYKALYNLLTLFDSPISPDSLIFFINTNYPELLDPALIRPGRIEQRIYIGPPEGPELAKFFTIFFEEEYVSEFIEAYGNRKKSPAALLTYLSKQKTARDAITNIKDLEEIMHSFKLSDFADIGSVVSEESVKYAADKTSGAYSGGLKKGTTEGTISYGVLAGEEDKHEPEVDKAQFSRLVEFFDSFKKREDKVYDVEESSALLSPEEDDDELINDLVDILKDGPITQTLPDPEVTLHQPDNKEEPGDES